MEISLSIRLSNNTIFKKWLKISSCLVELNVKAWKSMPNQCIFLRNPLPKIVTLSLWQNRCHYFRKCHYLGCHFYEWVQYFNFELIPWFDKIFLTPENPFYPKNFFSSENLQNENRDKDVLESVLWPFCFVNQLLAKSVPMLDINNW